MILRNKFQSHLMCDRYFSPVSYHTIVVVLGVYYWYHESVLFLICVFISIISLLIILFCILSGASRDSSNLSKEHQKSSARKRTRGNLGETSNLFDSDGPEVPTMGDRTDCPEAPALVVNKSVSLISLLN